jgi:hypothetical protein
MKIISSKNSLVYDATIIQLPRIFAQQGNITAINNEKEIPFAIKRIYYLYDVPGGESRGGHAHKKLMQLIVAASGSFDIVIDDSKIKRTFTLSRPDYGLFLPAGLWRELVNFSSGAICLVLASLEYSEVDYIRFYDEFIKFKKQ